MEKPILFKSDMVRAILDGRKTQTRRIAKLPKKWHRGYGSFAKNPHGDEEIVIHGDCGTKTTYCPHGRVGDKLWVRETFCTTGVGVGGISYKASGDWKEESHPWKSPRYMPKILARLWLEVIGVRVERLQDISGEDVIAEGIKHCADLSKMVSDRARFLVLWESIHGFTKYAWRENPWVWVIEFKVIKP